MVNQDTPYGNISYNQTGTSTYTGADGKTYSVPQFTQTTTLNPQQQSTLDQSQQAATNIASTANSLSSTGLSQLSQPVDTSGAPALQTSLGSGYTSTLGNDYSTNLGSGYTSNIGNGYSTSLGSDYNTSFGGDVSQAYNDAKNAVMDQYTPTLDRNAESTRAQELASGVRSGSAAYSANEQTIGDNYTRAANQATETAQSVENQLFNQQQQQAAYTDNALLNQANYTNNAALNQAQFGNSALLNQFNSQNSAALNSAQFGNSALLNSANFNNSANSQYLQNYYTQRDQPLNELSALLSGSQVQNAAGTTTGTPSTQVAGTDYSSLVNQQYQNQYQQYQNTLSGISSLGTGLLSFL